MFHVLPSSSFLSRVHFVVHEPNWSFCMSTLSLFYKSKSEGIGFVALSDFSENLESFNSSLIKHL